MGERIAVRQSTRRKRSCQHRWIIETPHGVTSRGSCKLCGARKRFPNAAEDALADSGRTLGRWSARRGVARPTQVKLSDQKSK